MRKLSCRTTKQSTSAQLRSQSIDLVSLLTSLVLTNAHLTLALDRTASGSDGIDPPASTQPGFAFRSSSRFRWRSEDVCVEIEKSRLASLQLDDAPDWLTIVVSEWLARSIAERKQHATRIGWRLSVWVGRTEVDHVKPHRLAWRDAEYAKRAIGIGRWYCVYAAYLPDGSRGRECNQRDRD